MSTPALVLPQKQCLKHLRHDSSDSVRMCMGRIDGGEEDLHALNQRLLGGKLRAENEQATLHRLLCRRRRHCVCWHLAYELLLELSDLRSCHVKSHITCMMTCNVTHPMCAIPHYHSLCMGNSPSNIIPHLHRYAHQGSTAPVFPHGTPRACLSR